MKYLLLAVLLCASSFAFAKAGSPGVEDGSCYTSATTGDVSVDVTGNTMGNSEVTVTDAAGKSGSTDEGTPDPDGGCSDSPSFKVGARSYRCKDGDLQFKNDNGSWIDMSETSCSDADNAGDAFGHNSIGSLP